MGNIREWNIASTLLYGGKPSRDVLEELGFEIIGTYGDDFYTVRSPPGWSKVEKPDAWNTTIFKDENLAPRLEQRYMSINGKSRKISLRKL